MKKIIIYVAIVVLAIVCGISTAVYYSSSAPALGGSYSDKGAVASTTAFSVAQTSVTVLPSRGNRAFTVLTNNSANDMYVRLDGTAATVNSGMLLRASTTQFINETTPYRGPITVISAAGTNSLLVIEGIYNP